MIFREVPAALTGSKLVGGVLVGCRESDPWCLDSCWRPPFATIVAMIEEARSTAAITACLPSDWVPSRPDSCLSVLVGLAPWEIVAQGVPDNFVWVLSPRCAPASCFECSQHYSAGYLLFHLRAFLLSFDLPLQNTSCVSGLCTQLMYSTSVKASELSVRDVREHQKEPYGMAASDVV